MRPTLVNMKGEVEVEVLIRISGLLHIIEEKCKECRLLKFLLHHVWLLGGKISCVDIYNLGGYPIRVSGLSIIFGSIAIDIEDRDVFVSGAYCYWWFLF